jgi:hypothetical protein
MRGVEVHSKVERDLRAASVAKKVGSVHGQRSAIKSMPGISARQGFSKFVVHRWLLVVVRLSVSIISVPRIAFASLDSLAPDSQVPALPNKTPEPTTTAVTPRAIECVVELKQMNRNRFEARGAPAAVVAHLERSAYAFEGLRKFARCCCRQGTGLGTRLARGGKVQIRSWRQSGERVLIFLMYRCFVGGSAAVVFKAFRPRGLIVNLALLNPDIQIPVAPNKPPEPTTMAVTARAPSSTSRASHGRGSS